MKSISPEVKKKAKEIVGDSTGKEAALKIAEYYNKKNSYIYGIPPRCGKTWAMQLKEERMRKLNCSGRMHKMRK